MNDNSYQRLVENLGEIPIYLKRGKWPEYLKNLDDDRVYEITLIHPKKNNVTFPVKLDRTDLYHTLLGIGISDLSILSSANIIVYAEAFNKEIVKWTQEKKKS